MAAMSYDSVELLHNFSERSKIDFPLLADPDYKIIDAFGIVNTDVPKDSPHYGFAYAGYYLVNPEGVVTSKFFNEENNNRTTAANILVREFDAAGDSAQGEAETPHLVVRWSASNPDLRPGQRVALILEVEPKAKMHVYAPQVEGYIPVSWTMTEAEGKVEFAEGTYPTAKTLHLPAIDESVPVYDSKFRVLRDLRLLGGRVLPEVLTGQEELTVEGEFTYQACDDRKCYFPVTLPLKWTFQLTEHDLIRAPEAVQRQ